MTVSPRFWAEGGKVCSRFMEPMSEAEALFHLEQVSWLAVNDTRMPEVYSARWAELVAAIRQAKQQGADSPVREAA